MERLHDTERYAQKILITWRAYMTEKVTYQKS